MVFSQPYGSPQYPFHRPALGQLVHQLVQLAQLLHARVGDGLHLNAAHLAGDEFGSGIPFRRAVDERAVADVADGFDGRLARQPGDDSVHLILCPALAPGLLHQTGIHL